MRIRHDREPSPGWRTFLKRHATEIWACDFFCVQTVWFKTLYTFFVVGHASREVLHLQVTRHPTAEWVAQQIVECCGWDRPPPRFLENLGITQIRTPFRAPQANSIAERWVGSLRRECLDHAFILNERHLRKVLAEYVQYFNRWRPHRAIGQRAPCAVELPVVEARHGEIIGEPVLGGLHYVYHLAA
jgi:transposase InsO family protein